MSREISLVRPSDASRDDGDERRNIFGADLLRTLIGFAQRRRRLEAALCVFLRALAVIHRNKGAFTAESFFIKFTFPRSLIITAEPGMRWKTNLGLWRIVLLTPTHLERI